MYLFLPTVHSLIICIVTQLYIPQCIYFYDTIKFKYKLTSSFTFHNVSISTQTGSLSFSAMWLYIPQCIYFYLESVKYLRYELDFTFHNVSISTCLAEDIKVVMCSLHSTMYLFLRNPRGRYHAHGWTLHSTMYLFLPCFRYHQFRKKWLYIPQCIYFYRRYRPLTGCHLVLYIPQCIYFYRYAATSDSFPSTNFTFHNVSISTRQICAFGGFHSFLYIPQCIYFYPIQLNH